MKRLSWFPTDLAQEGQELWGKKPWDDRRHSHYRRGFSADCIFPVSEIFINTRDSKKGHRKFCSRSKRNSLREWASCFNERRLTKIYRLMPRMLELEGKLLNNTSKPLSLDGKGRQERWAGLAPASWVISSRPGTRLLFVLSDLVPCLTSQKPFLTQPLPELWPLPYTHQVFIAICTSIY